MEGRFSGCEIVEMGIQIEENGKEFYLALAEMAENSDAAGIFKYLASDEEKHRGIFREIFTSMCDYEPKEAYPEEYFAYMRALADQYVFTRKNKGREIAKSVKNCDDGINLGIGFEKDSILFYEGMRQMVSAKDRELIDKLIGEEKKHLKKLLSMNREDIK